jgi:hypothetical protein
MRTVLRALLLQQAVFLIEPADAAAAVEDVLAAAGPGRMRIDVDLEMQIVARLAPGRAGLEDVPLVMVTVIS